jgi:hypothetical protein
MRIADKIYTSLLQRQAQPRETSEPQRSKFPKRESLLPNETQPSASPAAQTGDSLEVLSHPAVRTLDALIRDRVMAYVQEEDQPSGLKESSRRLSQLAESLKYAAKSDQDEIIQALLSREDVLTTASEQNANLLGESLSDFLR